MMWMFFPWCVTFHGGAATAALRRGVLFAAAGLRLGTAEVLQQMLHPQIFPEIHQVSRLTRRYTPL